MTGGQLDPRTNPYRPDLASKSLAQVVTASRYVDPWPMEITAGIAPVMAGPGDGTGQVTQALFGEPVQVYEQSDGWSWVQIGTDLYVGYVHSSALGPVTAAKSHKIRALRTYRYSKADLKSPPLGVLSLSSPVSVSGRTGNFCKISGNGYIHGGHIAALDEFETDFVAVAERFAGTPYLWGGRSSIGLDCSALVQLALAATGVPAPRDSDMQMSLGEELSLPDEDCLTLDRHRPAPPPRHSQGLSRGDLIFWPGHVGIMSSETILLHANAHHMAVVQEPLAEAVRRISVSGLKVIGLRRL